MHTWFCHFGTSRRLHQPDASARDHPAVHGPPHQPDASARGDGPPSLTRRVGAEHLGQELLRHEFKFLKLNLSGSDCPLNLVQLAGELRGYPALLGERNPRNALGHHLSIRHSRIKRTLNEFHKRIDKLTRSDEGEKVSGVQLRPASQNAEACAANLAIELPRDQSNRVKIRSHGRNQDISCSNDLPRTNRCLCSFHNLRSFDLFCSSVYRSDINISESAAGFRSGIALLDARVAEFRQRTQGCIHAANNLPFASFITADGVPSVCSASWPPATLISGTSHSAGVSSASVPPTSN